MSESIETNPSPTTSSPAEVDWAPVNIPYSGALRTFDVTLPNGDVATFEEAHDATECGGVLTIVGPDGSALAVLAPGAWSAIVWRHAKCTITERKEAA
jgi:hypothetical protein